MRRFLLLSACCCFSLAASAAIITERNDVYNGLGIYAPSQYTFVGSASHPGIESCWIPYGTYTGGSGGTEYLRVTDHLMGVVASALAGFSERAQHSPFMLRPLGIPNRYSYWTDDGAFLESTTNLSLRIADQFNLPLMYVRRDGTNYTYTVMSGTDNCLEDRLLSCAEWFGSRRLESLITAQGHSIEPPISSEWSSILPYNVSDTNLWRYVYPVLGYCTNDIHFLPAGGIGQGNWNAFPYGWSFSSSESIWGNDVVQGYWDVVWGTDGNPLPFTIEDVLSYDTGWKYEVPPKLTNDYWTVNGRRLNRDFVDGEWDDWPNSYYALWSFYTSNFIYRIAWFPPDHWQYEVYTNPEGELVSLTSTRDQPTSTPLYFEDGTVATKTELFENQDDYVHWRNGTTRLDWKRLGIICQLERQMEIGYERNDVTDELPLYTMAANHKLEFYSDNPIEFPISGNPRYNGEQWSHTNLFQDASWSQHDERYSSETNQTYWSTPTCRVPAPSISPYVNFGANIVKEDMELDEEHLEDLINDLAFTNGLTSISLSGSLIPSGRDSPFMYINYNCSASGTIEVEIPSNTVEVSATDGFHDSMWSTNSLEGHQWSFYKDGKHCNVYLSQAPGEPKYVDMGYRDESGTFSMGYRDYASAVGNDSITTPQLVIHRTSGGPVTNWTWMATGYGAPQDFLIVDGFAVWQWDVGYIRVPLDNSSYQVSWTDENPPYGFLVYINASGETPSTLSTPSVTVTWDSSSYAEERHIDSPDVYDYYFPVVWGFPETTNEVFAVGTLGKRATATFTYAEDDKYTNIVNSFNWPWSYDWNRIYSQRRSELDLLLYASGSASRCDITTPDYEFTWEGLKRYVDPEAVNYVEDYDGEVGRLFRMMQGYNSLTYESAKRARYNQIVALNAACMSKCEDLGGMPVSSINNFAKITAAERAAFLKDMNEADTIVTFRISAPDNLSIEANIHWDEESGRYILDRLIYPTLPIHIGSYGFSAEATGIWSNSTTNSYNAARADGWQAPVNKTLYKFKNLRDPNL